MKDSANFVHLRDDLLGIYKKLDDFSLIRLYNILHSLDLHGITTSFCIEILEERGYDIYHLPKHVHLPEQLSEE